MSLPGKTKIITVEPVRRSTPAPEPKREPVKEPERKPEKVPA